MKETTQKYGARQDEGKTLPLHDAAVVSEANSSPASEDTSCIVANHNPRHCVHKSHYSLVLCQTQTTNCIHNPLKSILISSFHLELGLPSGLYYPLGFLPIPSMKFPTPPPRESILRTAHITSTYQQ
jgi:hypothetical protein